MITVAALYVSKRSPYWGRPDVDAWDESRDARLYAGPWPVVAHPPCARWCRLAALVESVYGYRAGEDGGTFESALAAVHRSGGVLEHPAHSAAWQAYGLTPPIRGTWQRSTDGAWCAEVSQAAYGHRARKLTWLYYIGETAPVDLDWSPLSERVWPAEAARTPTAFAELLLSIARSARG